MPSNVQESQPQTQQQMVAQQPEQTGDNTAAQTNVDQNQPRLSLRGGGLILDLCACFICCEACKGCCEAVDDCCCC